jgi:hypothetical protein
MTPTTPSQEQDARRAMVTVSSSISLQPGAVSWGRPRTLAGRSGRLGLKFDRP